MSTSTLDGKLFYRMMTGGASVLSDHIEELNALNVFPVSDGDTGTNMMRTMEGGLSSVDPETANLADAASRFARGALLSARGNSGVILSQIFAGISEGLKDCSEATAETLAEAYRIGVRKAYDAVQNPTEGTILTVFRESTEFASEHAGENSDLESFFENHLREGSRSLSATPELPEDRAAVLKDLIGETMIEVGINELEGKSLSPYRIETIRVPLDPDEEALYRENRAVYTGFLRRHGINFSSGNDWSRFLQLCARSQDGKQALRAFLEQRRIARGGKAKLRTVWELANRHLGERMIIFTADNATAYELGRIFYWPVLTHHTKAGERKEFLDRFRSGDYPVLVTSKVLNEGVDVPDAAVGVVLSGSGSVREHVQRLGRILRPAAGKAQAVLYELISADTSEENVSRRRRNHEAYRGHRHA